VHLYNKHRPKKFSQLIGASQKAAARLLQTKTQTGDIPHAILLTGPTGVGKTTIARLLAALLNCQTTIDDSDNTSTKDNPKSSEPCGKCDACIELLSGNELDIVDASRDTGIDSMRDIVRTLSQRSLHYENKVVIFDEAHGLSKPAQNSLLTVLEDPPPHVVMILCTTDPRKLLKPLKGRCIHIGLNTPARPSIIELLVNIAAEEKQPFEARNLSHKIGQFESIREAINKLEVLIYGGVSTEEESADVSPDRVIAKMLARGDRIDTARSQRDVGSLLKACTKLPGARAVVISYLHACIINNLGDKQRGALIPLWRKMILVLARHDADALPALFSIDVLEAFKVE
jgi:DNA polymerase III subunit gamma/tau